ncbi:neither inactivation nor afterpotential protein G [Trichogramma pretiosum]|uniref:neither inactivation nor afterpotential protein G n=1 Tax=Trichogramma pretiosum TaxID=7493 RepID=UPI000C71ACB4|nr:neither inactivation nor afterpotential protein G [Trichogramma pretiosum]
MFRTLWNYSMVSLSVLLVSLVFRRHLQSPASIVDRPLIKKYDYIVVGAGTAGCVLASRLSEQANASVLLLEAGGLFGWLSNVPLAAPALQRSQVDWSYQSTPQLHSTRGMLSTRQRLPRGKGLGGSGQLNYLVHSFGRVQDYADWPKGWTHPELQPYFDRVAQRMSLTDLPPEWKLADAALEAQQLLNITVQRAQSSVRFGKRWGSLQSHLQQAWNRQNLHIVMNARVTKILLDANNSIEGVRLRYEDDGTRDEIRADREVIVCAGAIASPQLLMLSGIGPSDQLLKHQITVQLELPAVGQNYVDHFTTPMYGYLEAPVSITFNRVMSLPTIMDYFVFGNGLLATNGIMAIARLDTSAVILAAIGTANEKLLKDISDYRTDTFRSMFPTYNSTDSEGFTFMSLCHQPKSRGNVSLASSSIDDQPNIEPAYLEHPDDVNCSIKAIRLGLAIIDTPKFQELGARPHLPDFKECRHLPQDYHDDDYAECVVKVAGITGHHPSGTCVMGEDRLDSVVDLSLRVHGVEGLRIVDASVLPGPISGTPNSLIIALAEKAADLIIGLVDSH